MKRILTALALTFSGTLNAQTIAASGTFITMLGSDTVAIERYTRTGTRLEGDRLTRFPRVQLMHYVADLSDGKFKGMSLATRPVDADQAAPPILSISTILLDSTATIEVQRNGRPDSVGSRIRTFKGRASPSIPGVPGAFGFYEQILALNRPAGRDSVTIAMLGPGAAPNASLIIHRRSPETLAFISSFAPGWVEIVTVDANGRITAVDGTATTVKTISRRAAGIDFDATAKAWAAIETARGRAGPMSPPDTVRATVGAANLEVIYSRPFKRGRDVWGTVVEWNKPWRTGANAATQLTTSADLVVGETVLPAGKYTLWSLPTPTGTKLIINSQTGQWGTEYDPAKDFSRFDMAFARPSVPVEQFTIAIVPQGPGGALRLSWDNREYSIPFRVK